MSSMGGRLDALDFGVNIDRGVGVDDVDEVGINGVGPEMDAVETEAECRDADDRLVKRRCNEGFLILRARKEEGDEAGPFNKGEYPVRDSGAGGGRRVIGVVGALPAIGN
jgi:hypothetical protein